MLTSEGWVDGLSATICLLFAFILGLSIMIQAYRIRAKLLFLMGTNIFLAGFFWSVRSIDFLSVVITSNNFVNSQNWIGMGILRWIWSPSVVLISMYIGFELMIPDKKKYIIYLFIILYIVWIFLLLVFPNQSFMFYYTTEPGENLIDVTTNSLAELLLYVFEIAGIVVCGFGYLVKGIQTTVVIRKKFLLLSIGYFLFAVSPLLIAQILGNFVGRIVMASSFFFFYYGLRVEPEEKKPKREKEDVKIRESLFRLYERPSYITEEEVVLHKERNICLVCKNKVLRISYICPKCNALYCSTCAEKLSDMENMCWVCNEPFDETKPTRKYREPKEEKKKLIKKAI